MKRKIVKQVLLVVLISAIPSILSYLANSSLIFDKLIEEGFVGESLNIKLVQDYCLCIGIVISALFLSLNLIITKIKYENAVEQRNSLIKMQKTVFASALGMRFSSDPSSFDIRIFVPKHPVLYRIADKLHFKKVKKKFVIKNIDLIAEQGLTKNLQFEVYPKHEGLVGICYNDHVMVLDDNLEKTNDKNYEMNQSQIDKTSNLKWSICYPILDNSDVVVAIIALDGQTRITIGKDKENDLKNDIGSFSHLLYTSVPQLFKR